MKHELRNQQHGEVEWVKQTILTDTNNASRCGGNGSGDRTNAISSSKKGRSRSMNQAMQCRICGAPAEHSHYGRFYKQIIELLKKSHFKGDCHFILIKLVKAI